MALSLLSVYTHSFELSSLSNRPTVPLTSCGPALCASAACSERADTKAAKITKHEVLAA